MTDTCHRLGAHPDDGVSGQLTPKTSVVGRIIQVDVFAHTALGPHKTALRRSRALKGHHLELII